MRTPFLLTICAGLLGGAVVIDRIAVVVGKSAIKSSDIERDLRLTEFLNREPLNLSSQARRAAAERLIDQQAIRAEIATGAYSRATGADAQAMLQRLARDRFAGSDARMSAELKRYGITMDELRQHLLWQLTVLRFIQERFQAGVSVSDQDEQAYYSSHLAELKRQYPDDSSFAALEPKIHDILAGEGVNKDFESWLDQARQNTRIEYHQEAFQ